MSRDYLFGVDEEKLDRFRAVMDIRTYEMLVELLSRDDEYGGCIPWPYVKIESILLNERFAGWLAKMYGKGIKDVYLGYDSSCIRSYSEYDRVL